MVSSRGLRLLASLRFGVMPVAKNAWSMLVCVSTLCKLFTRSIVVMSRLSLQAAAAVVKHSARQCLL